MNIVIPGPHELDSHVSVIDIIEAIALKNDWDFDRVADDQIAMSIEGQWRTYSVTIVDSRQNDTLRLVCSYQYETDESQLKNLYTTLNALNALPTTMGMTTFWNDQNSIVYRSALPAVNNSVMTPQKTAQIIFDAITAHERNYPAIMLSLYGNLSTQEAIQKSMAGYDSTSKPTHIEEGLEFSPLDFGREIASEEGWGLSNDSEDSISLAVKTPAGSIHPITLTYKDRRNILEYSYCFQLNQPLSNAKLQSLYSDLEAHNDQSWLGGFTYDEGENQVVFKYKQRLFNDDMAPKEKIKLSIDYARNSMTRAHDIIANCLEDETQQPQTSSLRSQPIGNRPLAIKRDFQ